MEKMIRTALLALLVAAPLAVAAQNVHGGNGQGGGLQGGNGQSGGLQGGNGQIGAVLPTAGTCGVTRLDAFAQFIASRPTVSTFQAAYGCVQLVLPGDISTREMRHDNSRYFAEVDSFGRIVGGRFQ